MAVIRKESDEVPTGLHKEQINIDRQMFATHSPSKENIEKRLETDIIEIQFN